MMPGTIVGERVPVKVDGEVTGHRWKIYTVKSVTQSGACTLIRANEHSSEEGKTNKGFAEMVESGKHDDWRVLQTAGVDAAVTQAIEEQQAREAAKKAGEDAAAKMENDAHVD